MNKYTVEYRLVYTMTVEVEAEDNNEALIKAQAMEGEGEEHDVYAEGWDIIDCEEEEPSHEEIQAQKGDMAYREWRDSQ